MQTTAAPITFTVIKGTGIRRNAETGVEIRTIKTDLGNRKATGLA